MRYNKLVLKFLFTFSLFLLTIFVAVADPIDQSDPINFTEAVPIDGGLTLLLAAGVGYGLKKVRDDRKKSRKAADNIPEK